MLILSQCPCSPSKIGILDVLVLAAIVGVFFLIARKVSK